MKKLDECIKMYLGLPPFDSPENLCAKEDYYYNFLCDTFEKHKVDYAIRKIEDKILEEETKKAWIGMPLGVRDIKGNPVHVGDTLEFDEQEWGGPCQFVVEFHKGQISVCGVISDIPSWCKIVKKYYQ